jgi:hypothetical protein
MNPNIEKTGKSKQLKACMLTDHFKNVCLLTTLKKCMFTEEQTIEGLTHCLQFGNNKSIQWQA